MKLVTQAEFARLAGVNRSTVTRWIQNGRIQADPTGLIDPEAASRMREVTESKAPHHQARKQQWKILRGMSHEDIAKYHAEIAARRSAINEQIKEKNAVLRRVIVEENRLSQKQRKKTASQTAEYMAAARAYQKRIANNLTDAFIVKKLGKEFASPELIELKRQQIAIKRAINELGAAIKTEQEKNHE